MTHENESRQFMVFVNSLDNDTEATEDVKCIVAHGDNLVPKYLCQSNLIGISMFPSSNINMAFPYGAFQLNNGSKRQRIC